MRDLDSQIEAATLAEGVTETRRNGEGEGAEIRRLAAEVRMSDYGAAIETRSLDGAQASTTMRSACRESAQVGAA